MVKVIVDGREVDVPRGTLVVDAATAAGIEIPVFCYHPKMKPAGACRMCLVEIEKIRGLPAACTTTVNEGMVVNTKAPAVVKQQKGLLEFLLTNHPLDCPVCDQGGECPLQDTTFKFGPGVSRFIEPKRHFVKPIALSDRVLLDRERCIMCLRCVRFQNEIAHDDALGIIHRGAHAEIGVFPGHQFDSPFSGNTIDICPVGALTSAKYRFRARPWDIRNAPTVCPHCSVGCNTNVTVRDTSVLRVLPRENTPVDDGWLCDRGRFTYEFVQSDDRLTSPLIKKDGILVPASWPEALGLIGQRLGAIGKEHGGHAIGGIISPQQTNEEHYLFQKLFRAVLGSNNVASDASGAKDCDEPLHRLLGYRAATGSIAHLEQAGVIFAIGTHTIEEQPILNLRIKKAIGKGARLILAGDGNDDLDKLVQQRLPFKQGTAAALLRSLLHVVLQENLVDATFAGEHGDIVEAVRASVAQSSPESAAETTGLTADAITLAGETIAKAKAATILYSATWAQEQADAEVVELLVRLAQLTGNVGRIGGGLDRLLLEVNAQGAIDMGVAPHLLPGHKAVGDSTARTALEQRWQSTIADVPGLGRNAMLQPAALDTLKAMYLIGVDPVGKASEQDNSKDVSSLGKLEFLVVQDTTLTSTGKLADVVLPGVTYIEKEGTFTNLERRVQRIRVGLKRPGDAIPDWQIIQEVANALGGHFYYSGPREVLREVAAVVPDFAGITYARLGTAGLQWPCPTSDHPGTAVLYERPVAVEAAAAPA
jgi:NADH-quinone oxidoreductase chain G